MIEFISFDVEEFVQEKENFELIKRYFLSLQINDILSVNSNVNDVSKSLKRVIEIVNNVTNIDEMYDMLEDFGYSEIVSDLDTIKKWNNTFI